MKNIGRLLILQLVLAVLIIGCEKSPDNWPPKVTSSLYVPEKHDYIKYYRLEGSYQVIYKTNVCWPAEKFINSTVENMSQQGWRRLEEDFLNPGMKLPWTREKFRQWGSFEDQKGMNVHQWIDDWENKDNDIVRYFLRYTTKKLSSTSISSMDCNLDVVVIYMPKDIRPKTSDLEAPKKQHQ